MENIALQPIKKRVELIPFFEIMLSYTEGFDRITAFELPNAVIAKLQGKLLEDLSAVAEVTLQVELENFISGGNNDFSEFVEKMRASLANDYPVLDKILKLKASNFLTHIFNIMSRFRGDHSTIKVVFKIDSQINNLKIIDIDPSLGDGHNGEGTALIGLSDGTKLIYKPRNLSIVNSYNLFIDWVNFKLKIDLKTVKVLACRNYGWLEFVNHQAVNSAQDLQEYYHEAGILLAVTLVLGSKDCHRENVIASGKKSVIIDHETIIQPFLNNQSLASWDEQCKIIHFSILESALIINSDTGVPLDCAGYGVKGKLKVTEIDKKVINPNTINSKRATRFVDRNLVEKNVPIYKGNYIFANDYKEHFIKGFSRAYDMFLNSKEELKSHSSPLEYFKNQEIRYVWRPTFVYFKILRYMRAASFMSSLEGYNSKLYALLSKAYQSENMEAYKFMLDFEMSQMLKGDIPIFSLNSVDNSLEGNDSFKIFEYNCLENILHRIDLLSIEHKNEQLEFISRWLNS